MHMGIWQILLILLVILLIFGAARLPALAKSLGQSARAFKGEMQEMRDEDAARKGETSPEQQSAPQQAAPQQAAGYTLNGEPISKPNDSSQQ